MHKQYYKKRSPIQLWVKRKRSPQQQEQATSPPCKKSRVQIVTSDRKRKVDPSTTEASTSKRLRLFNETPAAPTTCLPKKVTPKQLDFGPHPGTLVTPDKETDEDGSLFLPTSSSDTWHTATTYIPDTTTRQMTCPKPTRRRSWHAMYWFLATWWWVYQLPERGPLPLPMVIKARSKIPPRPLLWNSTAAVPPKVPRNCWFCW